MDLSLKQRRGKHEKSRYFVSFSQIIGCLAELEILTKECVHPELGQFVLSEFGPNMLSYLLVVPGVAYLKNNNKGSAFVQKY